MTILCRQCAKPVEQERERYATPICFACLPPPEPLPVRCARPYVHDCQCPQCRAKPDHDTRGWEPK